MDAKEIRIGNWFEHNSEWCYRGEDVYQFQWEIRDWQAIAESTMLLENINPIPITHDKLIDFGFRRVKNPNNTPNWIWLKDTTIWFYQNWEDGSFELNSFDDQQKDIKYIHEIQNIYYYLNGKELEKL